MGRHHIARQRPHPTICSEIASDGAIYLEQFDWSAGDLDERDYHSRTRAVRRNDDVLPSQGLLQVVHLERHMRDGLDEVGIRRTLPVPLPLDAERIALMVTDGDFQVGKIDFPFEASCRWDANVIELHGARHYWPLMGTFGAGAVNAALDEVVVLNGYPGGPFT